MDKLFPDVFRTLNLDKRNLEMFEKVIVDRVCATKSRDFVRVYITSDHIIPKASIYKVEKLLRKSLFVKGAGKVKIYEKFILSDLYTPQLLFEEYRDSMMLEIGNYSAIDKALFENAEIEFTDPYHMHLTVEDSGFLSSKKDELERVLRKIFEDRCHLEVEIDFTFVKPEKADKPVEKYEFQPAPEGFVRHERDEEGEGESGSEDLNNGEDGIGTEDGTASGDRKIDETEDETATHTGQRSEGTGSGKGKLGLKSRFKDKKKQEPAENRKFKTNPDVLYGRDFEDEEVTYLNTILKDTQGDIIIHGQIVTAEDPRALKDNQRTMLIYSVSDFTDTIKFKLFVPNEDVPALVERFKPKSFVKIKAPIAFDKYDDELCIGRIWGIKKGEDFRVFRKDDSGEKRVELHCHTKMSDSDGVSEASDIVKTAYRWGHPAIAITDHGVVHAFPDAYHVWCDLWKAEKEKLESEGKTPEKQDFFKVIYGCEGYLVDDLEETVVNENGQDFTGKFVVFDIETTGISAEKRKIIEIGAVKIENGEITDRFSTFVNPETPIPYRIIQLTSITDDMVRNAPLIDEVLPKFVEFCEGSILVAHNAKFDTGFINANCKKLNIDFKYTSVDTVGMARILFPDSKNHKLDTICKKLNVVLANHHRAVDDAEATAHMFLKMANILKEKGIDTLKKLNEKCSLNPDIIKQLHPFHIIILVKNNTGRENLYHLVSSSFIDYFKGRPLIPKSLLAGHREGLILGTACEQGELYQAIIGEAGDDRISNIVDFYDFLEIQPLGNNNFMINEDKIETVNSREDLIYINKMIVKLGEDSFKPVVGTCDVHFLNPEDEIYRRIIMAGKGFKDADDQAPLYLRTTEEMLAEFDYLGSRKAREVVITNPGKIADMIDVISPVRPDKCPPVIPDSDEMLRRICYDRAHELYGDELPEIVESRLKKELDSIIGNGYAVMYIIAQKLVWKSVEDGYLVGSRGSVGSSLAAFMAGITEVNSLAAHYRCPKCKYVDFDSDVVKANVGNAGCDLPDAVCPVCGEPLVKDGFDIPFETFLGFEGDKEPDIDLNFSSEYQSKAHKYTEVIFGAGQTFRAGTVTGLADKTAYGYAFKYFKEHEIDKRSCEVERVAQGCMGVRQGTGQHPGGIIVLPTGEDINSFTPIQHPPKDDTIITTHFDYHSIDHNLLKLDILGHDDPTMIRMLQDLTGVEPTGIPLDDKKVMSLFQNTDALGITPDDIGGVKTGSLGLPEFGTTFVIDMLLVTKPQTLSDLIRISGLGHGTGVWQDNAQTIIEEGKADLAHCICCRDDIMIYLISKGIDPAKAFKIMEAVRKGNVAKKKCGDWDDWKQDMIDHDVPDWYIWSCEKIQYMFPKAHAAAYVMMGWRVGYFKINYPLAYYTAFFSIRAKGFDYEKMCFGSEIVKGNIAALSGMQKLSATDKALLRDLNLVREMYARGIEFMPIDVYRADARHFKIIDGKIMPSFMAIAGVAEAAADSIYEAAKMGRFTSRDDFRERTKVSNTIVETLVRFGILSDIPESNQISLFDIM
ncbi:MAG: PolC-type DNA polymerase III [Lachnospiraceae bacterium]|nr:PolC-type DNA polymerase III [Lachnospiraceae bacterium]